jgi:2-amino-4-hydroxy-6-hydroxymethyldihydropteridine diphosphokinase
MLPGWAVVTPTRRAHIERVATLLDSWSAALDLAPGQQARWLRAAWLHDALRDAEFADALAHGPAAADRAARAGERDQGVLDAVRYHSVGWAGWDGVGRALYCADFLEPGRPFADSSLATLARDFPSDSERTLREVARRRVRHAVREGYPLPPETVAFWNSLCAPG